MLSFDAKCVHPPDVELPRESPPLAPPIFAASVFETEGIDLAARALAREPGLYSYSRVGNPTVAAFETAVARLEGAEHGVATASGMGAMAGVLLGLTALDRHLERASAEDEAGGGRAGAMPLDAVDPSARPRVVVASPLYGTTDSLLNDLARRGSLEVVRAEGILRSDESQSSRLTAGDVVLAETISNPLLEVADIGSLAAVCKRAGALLVIDNTFASPYHCRPLELGADVVLHSASKYLGGHSDLIAGVAVTADTDLAAAISHSVMIMGATLSPFEAMLALRGLRTLHLRMERHSSNGAAVAAFLDEHAAVQRVWYPGLTAVRGRATRSLSRGDERHGAAEESPTNVVARRVLGNGFGGMVSFELRDRAAVDRFLSALTMIRFAGSLADVATTVSHPASTSHRDLSATERLASGITEGVIRLSVGVEDLGDIVSDLARGLDRADDE